MSRRASSSLVALALLAGLSPGGAAAQASSDAQPYDVVELVPQEPPKWSPANLFAPRQ